MVDAKTDHVLHYQDNGIDTKLPAEQSDVPGNLRQRTRRADAAPLADVIGLMSRVKTATGLNPMKLRDISDRASDTLQIAFVLP